MVEAAHAKVSIILLIQSVTKGELLTRYTIMLILFVIAMNVRPGFLVLYSVATPGVCCAICSW